MKHPIHRTPPLALLAIAGLGALAMTACGPQDGQVAGSEPPPVAAVPAGKPVAPPERGAAPAAPAAPAAAAAPRRDTVGAVKSITPITKTNATGAGAVVGGVVGGVVGHQFGKGDGKKAMTVVGAVGGAVAGNEIEKRRNRKVVGYRVKVQLDNGEWRTFEPAQLDGLKVGDRVRVEQGRLRKA